MPGEAALTAFATLGAYTTAQHIAAAALASMEEADPSLVAEESLALLSVVTARGLRDHGPAAAALEELPLTYRDYVIGGEMLGGDAESVLDSGDDSYERIGRKLAFYQTHFVAGRLPGPRVLKDKMELWMGRISPPGLPENPSQRLEKLGLVEVVHTHLRLLSAFLEQ